METDPKLELLWKGQYLNGALAFFIHATKQEPYIYFIFVDMFDEEYQGSIEFINPDEPKTVDRCIDGFTSIYMKCLEQEKEQQKCQVGLH